MASWISRLQARGVEIIMTLSSNYDNVLAVRAGRQARRDCRAKLHAQGLGRLPASDVDRLFEAHLDRLDVVLAGGGRLVGNATSIADIAVAAQLDAIIRTSARRERIRARPNISCWLGALAG
jgi:hypothetical protein